MKLDRILLLGNPLLYEKALPVSPDELPSLQADIQDLHAIILEFRAKYQAGRAVAAPQIGLMKRIICWNVERPITMINPELSDLSQEMMELWDDCMSFPHLLVRLQRHQTCTLKFWDENWQPHEWHLEGSLSELIQHEYDHLEGILATQRAIDSQSFRWR
ncbi:MAG: peptide deformylase [Microscillaceae bacterium]|jgi:peptide deformylase|nr:peptide deformylase [Microscillaceae bacterium]